MTTYTTTETYTRADVAKVFENFEAGLCLIARTTQLWQVDFARDIAKDVTAMAMAGYLAEAHIVLVDAGGRPARVHEYKVSTDASGWAGQRPDENIWSSLPGSLTVIVKYSAAWYALEASAQAQFKGTLLRPWTSSNLDTTYPGLSITGTRAYASNAFGLARTARERQP